MNHEESIKLQEPFPLSQVGKLPKGGQQLDYVGHGAVTARLLEVDPEWNWEPLAVDERGLPALDRDGNLWIRLTVCGVTRIGVGDGPTMKVLIGDALRNAAMRFGVALDLWVRGQAEDDEKVADQGSGKPRVKYATPEQMARIKGLTKKLNDEQRAKVIEGNFVCGIELKQGRSIVASEEDAGVVIATLESMVPAEDVPGGEPF